MEAQAYIKNVNISPKKMRFLLADVKKMKPVDAVHTLFYSHQRGAQKLRSAIQSALSNAKNTLKVSEDLIEFKTIAIEEGLKLKRFRAGGRGMAKPFKHKYSHIKVVLTVKEQPKQEKSLPAPETDKVKVQKSNVKSSQQKTEVSPKRQSSTGRKKTK